MKRILDFVIKNFFASLFLFWWLFGAVPGTILLATTIYLIVGYQNCSLFNDEPDIHTDALDDLFNIALWPVSMNSKLELPFRDFAEKLNKAFKE